MRDFAAYPVIPYIGQPQSYPIRLANISGQSVSLFLQWISYGALTRPNINVRVDMRTKPCEKLTEIRSVYIDNLGSEIPLYVSFPDTVYVVVAKPNSAGWYPVYTASKVAIITGIGFSPQSIPQTIILFSNIAIQPGVNVELDTAVQLWRASPIITRGNTTVAGKPKRQPGFRLALRTPASEAIPTPAPAARAKALTAAPGATVAPSAALRAGQGRRE
jgi:hypothetical protein